MIKVANAIWEGAPAHSLPPALPLVSARHGKALCCRHILHWRTCSTSTEGAATPVCPSPSTKLVLVHVLTLGRPAPAHRQAFARAGAAAGGLYRAGQSATGAGRCTGLASGGSVGGSVGRMRAGANYGLVSMGGGGWYSATPMPHQVVRHRRVGAKA